MLKKLTTTVFAVSALAVATQASALNGIKVNPSMGYGSQVAQSKLNTLGDRNQGHLMWSALIGYNFDFSKAFSAGIDAGYGEYGYTQWQASMNNIAQSYKTEQRAWLLLASLSWHASDVVDLLVKLGPAFGRTIGAHKVSSTPTHTRSSTSTRVMTALGLNYFFTPEFGMNVQWDHIFGRKVTNFPPLTHWDRFQTVNAFMIGLNYTFAL